MEDERIDGMMVRARVQWAATRDIPTLYMLKALAKRKTKQDIEEITWNGTTHKDIEAEEEFYMNLFAKKISKPEAREKMKEYIHLKLSKRSREMLKDPISEEELARATKIMRKGKAPGLDGLPVEVYRALPEILSRVKDMWNNAIREGHLPRQTLHHPQKRQERRSQKLPPSNAHEHGLQDSCQIPSRKTQRGY
eukprot:Phypoly_transcript_13195.p1 GENE.Phypoly_transcript_13195~~Phypoly_transcript_13195.p1  ORF type:complete len:194 (+),score=24.32 Phypoly_transcript_13195:276-857(+)